MRRLRTGVGLGITLSVLAARALGADLMPLSEVRPGMRGVGRTVFSGSRIEEFAVEVLGVLENVGPRQSLILVRLDGGPLSQTGVIAGMSGSPVWLGGRLAGAVAYGFPFSKETIAGVTPIHEMLAAAPPSDTRATQRRPAPPWTAAGAGRPLDGRAFVDLLGRSLPTLAPPFEWRSATGAPGGQSLVPLSLPLVFSGFDPATFEWARGIFSAAGFAPLIGAPRSPTPSETLPGLQPGGPIGLALVEGDLDLSVTGTVTHIDNGRVYAFGHPFYNLGPTQFPMKKAYVHAVFPSLFQSWRISSVGESVGTIDQDRAGAVTGRLGLAPRMIPFDVVLLNSHGSEQRFAFRLADDELFSPILSFIALMSVLQGHERALGPASLRVAAEIELAEHEKVIIRDVFGESQPALEASAALAAPLAYLMANSFAPLTVARIQVRVVAYETWQTARLERIWLERTALRAGADLKLHLVLRTHRGEALNDVIPVRIPPGAPAGRYQLQLLDAGTLNQIEQRELRQPFSPKDLAQLLRVLNATRVGSHLYARLVRNEDGAIAMGEYLQALPPSVLAVLETSSPANNVVPLKTAVIWERDYPTDFVVSGSRLLPITVER